MSRNNQWFVPGDGIAREVITADIQRYLGPDALVRPGAGNGENEGRPGYWITAYRTLTTNMIQDLKLDSQRWQLEKDRDRGHGSGGAYEASRTHASRQHYGPTTENYPSQQTKPSYAPQPFGGQAPNTESSHYTTAPVSGYAGTQYASYGQSVPPSHTPLGSQPRTYPQSGYIQQPSGREHPNYSSAPQASSYYSSPPVQDSYRQPAQPQYSPHTPQYPSHTPSVAAAPGYYIASDGRQYPLASQPPPEPPQRRRGN